MRPYKIRAYLQVNDETRKLMLSAVANETPEHLGLKLAAFLLFWRYEAVVDPSLKTAALTGQQFRPDLLGSDIGGSTALWVECGNTSEHKLEKVARRWPDARIVVLREKERDARGFRDMIEGRMSKAGRVEIFYFPDDMFVEWMDCLSDKAEVIGETSDSSLNLVVNERVFVADMKKC